MSALADIAKEFRGWAEMGASFHPSMILNYARRLEKIILDTSSPETASLDDAIEQAQTVAEANAGTDVGTMHLRLANWLRELRHCRKMEALKRRDEDYGDATALHMLGVRNELLREAVCRLEWIAGIAEKAFDVPERDREAAYDHALAEIVKLAKKPLSETAAYVGADWAKEEETKR